MLMSGQKVFYKESNKTYNPKIKYLGTIRKLKGRASCVAVNSDGYVLGSIRKSVNGIEHTRFGEIRIDVIIK